MTERTPQDPQGLTPEELEQELAAELPAREAMSLIYTHPTPSLPVIPDHAAPGQEATMDHMPTVSIQSDEVS